MYMLKTLWDSLAYQAFRKHFVKRIHSADIAPDDASDVQSESIENSGIRATIIVPRSLYTFIKTDEIVVLSEGVIVEKGRHDDLMTLNGIYANLWSNQLQRIFSEENKDDFFRIENEKSREKISEQLPAKPPPPPPPPPIPPALPSLLHKPLPSINYSQPVVKKNVPKPSNVLKSFNWTKISDMKIKGTFWSELTDSKLYENVELLKSIDSTFSAYRKGSIDNDVNAEQLEKYRPKNTSVIDGRRAQNCTILLSRLKMSDKEICEAILSMDLNDRIAADMVEQLLKFTPSAEEKLLLEEHSRHTDSLVRADRFLYEISQIPDYEQRLKSLLFKKQFTATVNDLLSRITSVTEASQEIKKSTKLNKLLAIILDLGNYMNYGPRGNAFGFHVASLNRLIDTKSSSVKGLTLLHYLVQSIEKEFGDLLSLPEEIAQVRPACKVSLFELDKDISMLRTDLAKICSFTTEEFYKEATEKLEDLERQFKEMRTRFDEVARRFGEDGSIMQPDEFFGIFSDFLTAFEEARQDNLKKVREEKRAKQDAELKKCRRSVSENSHFKEIAKQGKVKYFKYLTSRDER
ncbi:Disheveled-associated activator of morphogenesis 1-A [Pseudolycoriella hygida]|uniref:Disheveled-associated activator of morphogenesis 1-A n=1 Tax=Pseudolycoriella hygida TaxID=35572 RepID=A0A9Q0S763_9DIPT|nr:Disheveled-associated activator of morphogenesis 1-A [Pseudolycoriella hygida]